MEILGKGGEESGEERNIISGRVFELGLWMNRLPTKQKNGVLPEMFDFLFTALEDGCVRAMDGSFAGPRDLKTSTAFSLAPLLLLRTIGSLAAANTASNQLQ